MSSQEAIPEFIEKIADPKRDTKIISINMDNSIIQRMDTICKLGGMSRSYFIREACKLAFAQSKAHKDKGFVYLAQAEESSKFKIGRSKDVPRRMVEINSSFPVDVVPRHIIETNNMARTEKFFQDYFRHKHIRGEWFKLTKEDVNWFENKEYLNVPHLREAIEE